MLPTYSRTSRKPGIIPYKEKCMFALVLSTLCLLCFAGIFLPDDFGGEKVLKVVKKFKEAGPEIFIPNIPNPPLADKEENVHLQGDRQRLEAKIKNEWSEKYILDKPEVIKKTEPAAGVQDYVAGAQDEIDGKNEGVVAPPPDIVENNDNILSPPNKVSKNDGGGGGGSEKKLEIAESKDEDSSVKEKAAKIKEMALHAWRNYKLYAWGQNELKPLSKRPHSGSIFGSYDLGATIIDGLDTLYIMGCKEEYEEGRDWIERKFSLDNISTDLSVFETNIRFVGGLLSLYAFTGDQLYKEKAQHVADKLLPAFLTPTGIPYALVNLKTGHSKNYGWASGGSSILSEFGTLHLEFSYLSDVTGNPTYRERVQNIRQFLKEIEKPNGLYPNYLNPKTGKWGQLHMSLGALGDSYFEYLLKSWIQSGQTDEEARTMYDEAMAAISKRMVQNSAEGLTYVSDMKFDKLEYKMDHLACFSGGLFALGAATRENEYSKKFMNIGKGITNTCHESYIRSDTGLGPESFRFTEAAEARALKSNEKYYILRPETFESYFILWRLTHDQKYRDWGWEAVQALEKYCRTPNGYSGIRNVYQKDPQKDDVQQSFFLAETLKYLYLLFSDDSLLPLDEWVFNTEAHPIPIRNNNNLYRMAPPSDIDKQNVV